ncbi:peptidoglycan-associated lipoprotein Pal [Sulfuricaulis sp.]|jgi:peptidoglycan-associated lipoprotein|uniref:peptidoglycan-associated lipoprotein Pal n=1 Tax=Sulfuricaulis sp. TaxID=2003553 RepID=UPI00355A5D8C
MKNRKHLAASLLIALALAGCAGEEATKPTPGDEKGAASAQTGSATDKSATGASLSEREKQRRAELLAQHSVHFAFDSSTIDDEARAIVEAHAAHLVANPQIKLSLEGNCDERGTREYNLALGERRAQAVEKMMKVLGVTGNRIKTVSYGEEKPLCQEHNESCWRQNRRAEIVYK